jgi:hypothetical protein
MENQTRDEDRLVIFSRYVKAYWHAFGLVASATVISLASLPFAATFYLYMAVPGAILGIVSVSGQVLQKPSYVALIKQRDQSDGHARHRSMLLEKSLGVFLHRLAREIEATQSSVRLSVYCHKDASFVMLARVSANPKFEVKGRALYPDDQGVIASAWQNGRAYLSSLPQKKEERVEVLVEAGFPEDVANSLTMPSRSLVGVRLSENDEHVGVLIVESTAARGVGSSTLDRLESSKILAGVATMMYSSKDHFPTMLELANKGHVTAASS